MRKKSTKQRIKKYPEGVWTPSYQMINGQYRWIEIRPVRHHGKLIYQKRIRGLPSPHKEIETEDGYVKIKPGELQDEDGIQLIEIHKEIVDGKLETTSVYHKTISENNPPNVEIKRISNKDPITGKTISTDDIINFEKEKLEFSERGLYDKVTKEYVGRVKKKE